MRRFFVLFCCLALTCRASAQSYVRISSTEIIEGSKTYILHTVSPSETVYGICRAYGIAEAELLALNPFVKKGLQAGQQLKILKKTGAKKTDASKTAPAKHKPAVTFTYHIVDDGETLYSIAKRYDIELKDLLIANPELGNVLQAGQILRIPHLSNADDAPKPLPQVKEKDKNKDKKNDAPAENYAPEPALPTSANSSAENNTKIPDQCIQMPLFEEQINIALMLPFGTQSGADDEELLRSFEFAEFYEGALIALEKLKRMGAKIKLYVWDTENGDIKKTLNHSSFHNAHLIIGPVYPEVFNIAAEFARERSIPIVSPLAPVDALQHDNPYVYQVAVSDEHLIRMLLQHCLADAQDANVVLISQAGERSDHQTQSLYQKYLPDLNPTLHQNHTARLDSLRLAALVGEYENRRHQPQVQQINYHTGLLPRDNSETFLKVFLRNEVNRVIVASEDEPFVAEIMANLKAFSDYYGCYIEVYGANKWRKFENVELEVFYHLNLNIASPYFVDYQSDYVVDFIKRYRSRYKTEPSQMAFQGYDAALYFAGALFRYGLKFQQCLPWHGEELMQSVYRFSAPMRQYHRNSGGFLLRYRPETMGIETKLH